MIIGKGKDIIGNVFDELVSYPGYHLGTEEKYFDQYGYPEDELHKQLHKELVEQVAALHKRFNAREKVLTFDVMNFMRDWLHEHFVGSDKLFSPYLISKGVS